MTLSITLTAIITSYFDHLHYIFFMLSLLLLLLFSHGGLHFELDFSLLIGILSRDNWGNGDQNEVENDIEGEESYHGEACNLPPLEVCEKVCETIQAVADDHHQEVVQHLNIILSISRQWPD